MYKKVDGETERVLFIPKGFVSWVIKECTRWCIPWWIGSGRGTSSPASSDAGASDRMGVTKWQYYERYPYIFQEADISVSCIEE